jgi:hypothetical protein
MIAKHYACFSSGATFTDYLLRHPKANGIATEWGFAVSEYIEWQEERLSND